jgi:hypothetical protein
MSRLQSAAEFRRLKPAPQFAELFGAAEAAPFQSAEAESLTNSRPDTKS